MASRAWDGLGRCCCCRESTHGLKSVLQRKSHRAHYERCGGHDAVAFPRVGGAAVENCLSMIDSTPGGSVCAFRQIRTSTQLMGSSWEGAIN